MSYNKFNDYQSLDILQEYVLVNTKHQRVEIFRRDQEGFWVLQTYTPTEETLELQSINLTVSLRGLYEDLEINA